MPPPSSLSRHHRDSPTRPAASTYRRPSSSAPEPHSIPPQGYANQAPPATAAPRSLTSEEHDTLLRHRLSTPTIRHLLELPACPPPNEILASAARATELNSYPLRPAEKALFTSLNAGHLVLWSVAVPRVTQTWEKAFIMAQCEASGDEWIYLPRINPQARKVLLEDRRRVIRVLVRVLRCAAELMGHNRDATGVRRALELARCIAAGAWEGDEGWELLQVPGVGKKKLEALKTAGVKQVRKLKTMEFYHIERILKRNPPFGQEMVFKLQGFPSLNMRGRVERWASPEDLKTVEALIARSGRIAQTDLGEESMGRRMALCRIQLWVQNDDLPTWRGRVPWVSLAVERGTPLRGQGQQHVATTQRGGTTGSADGNRHVDSLVFFWRGSTKRLMGEGQTFVFSAHMSRGETVFAWASCDEIVGTLVETQVTAPA